MSGVVVVSGRFPAGVQVHLFAVGSERVLSHVGGELVETRKADENGLVVFRRGVVPGARYIAFGYTEAGPLEVRCAGHAPGEQTGGLAQAPVQADVVKHADGQLVGGVYRPLPDPPVVTAEEPGEVDSAPAADLSADGALRGQALQDKLEELGIEGTSKMSADEKRAAVAGALAARLKADGVPSGA